LLLCNDYVPWSSNTGVYVFGDANDNWVNTRKIWNQHAYHITNVNDDTTIPQCEENNWEIYNNFRCQAIAEGTFTAPDLSACYIRIDDINFPISIDITTRIGNGGAVGVKAGVSVAFYDGNPNAGGTLLGIVTTNIDLPPGYYEDITFTWLTPIQGYHDFYVVVDDDGTGQGSVGECCELNNIWNFAATIGQIPPTAEAGPNQTIYENDIVLLDGSASSDLDGTIVSYEWDFDSSDGLWWDTGGIPEVIGPITSHIYGDDGNFTVTLSVTDDQNLSAVDTCNITILNVDPTVTIQSATMDLEIGLRVAGRKFNDVGMTLFEEGIPIGYVSIERLPGSPNDQMAWIPVTLDMTKAYSAIVTYIPEDPPNVGANPVWIYIKSENGSIRKIHHTFNVQQSKKRDSEHWNHVEPWEVDLNLHLIGHHFEVTTHVTDPGSDDETLTYTYDTQVEVVIYLNNPPDPDLYPSPEVNPRDIMDTTILTYEGPGTLKLLVEDDDGGITLISLNLG